MKNLIKTSLLILALMLSATICVQAQLLSTGELAFNSDGTTPSVVGQTGKDHIFTRNTYNDAESGTTYDNLVSFKTGEIQVVDFWLDDDQIYTNAEIQALTPVPCFSDGSQLYNEITYNGCEFNLYLPMQMQLVKYQFPGENRAVKYQAGDRLPWDATLDWNEVDTKVIEGIEYRVYKVIIRTLEKNACHFSGNEEAYENNGNKPLKKDDAPLFRLAIQNNNQSQSQGRLADMIIASQEFSIREALMNFVDEYGNIDVNRVRFFYGAGGNNQTQRFLKYNRVTLYGSAGINEPILPRPFEVDGICYEGINRYEVFVSSRLGDDAYHDNVSIPETVSYQGKTYNVKAVGASAFLYCTGLTGVSIPSSVTAIGDCAFMGCSGLSRVTCMAFTPPSITSSNVFDSSTCSNALLSVPGGSKSVYQSANGWSAFAHIQEFTSDFEVNGIYYNITGDNTVEVTFRDTEFNSYSGAVEIPDSVKFNGVTYIVTAIGEIAFMNCSNLTDVFIPNTVTTIDLGAFANCDNLQSAIIPNSVTTINNMAFRGCTSLALVGMGNGVTYIGQSAFDDCPAITSVICLAYTPPTMGNSAVFSDAVYSNATLYVRRPLVSSYRSADWWKNFSSIRDWDYDLLVDGIYYCCTSNNTVEVTYDFLYETEDWFFPETPYTGDVSIPETITSDGKTYQVTSIGEGAFMMCPDLTSVTIPETVTKIGQMAFLGCTSLTSVSIPNSVTEIGLWAFGGCSGLTSVTIGSGVVSMENAFNNCTGITSVTCLATTPPILWGTNDFADVVYSNATLYVPYASVSAYRAAVGWKDFAHIEGIIDNFILGDLNFDGVLDVSDVTAMIALVLGYGTPNLAVADLNFDGQVDVSDVTALISHVLNGTVPALPFQTFTVNGVTFKMINVEGGTFMMGGADDDPDAYPQEFPRHQVTLSGFAIGETEVTQALWEAVMGSNPSYFPGHPKRPVDQASWDDCQEFVAALNALTGKQFRLPSEAEWEYAARGGKKSQGYLYAGSNNIDEVAWYMDNSYNVGSSSPDYGTHDVATKAPNELGLYDMTGNAWELVQDWYGSYSSIAQTDPTGPTTGTMRVIRGGCWDAGDWDGRVTARRDRAPSYKTAGLRLALDKEDGPKFRLSQNVVTVSVGGRKSVNILNGHGTYTVDGGTDNVTCTINGNILTVKGTNEGTSNVQITDVSTGATTILTVIVKIIPNDGVDYEPVNGIGIKNVWIQDRAHTPEVWTSQPYCNLYARTAVIHDGNIYIACSNANIVIQGVDTLYQSVIYVLNANDGSLVRELPLTLDGAIYGNTVLNCNAIGVDNFGHLYMAPYSSGISEIQPVYMVDKNTGELTLIEELDKSDMLNRIDVIDVMGDITRQNAECNIMAAGAQSKCVYRWHANQGGDFEAGFDDDPYLEIKNFYPATVSHWGYVPVVKMAQVQENDYSGALFYVDGFYSAPILYDLTGRMVDNFENVNPNYCPMDVGCNGVCEFTLDGRTFLVYVAAQYGGYDEASGQNKACQVYISELGNNRSFSGMRRYWMVPDALGTVSDGGTRVQSINVEYGTDEFGNEEVTLFIFKCYNGMAVYKIGSNVL